MTRWILAGIALLVAGVGLDVGTQGAAAPGGGQVWVAAQDSGRLFVLHGQSGIVDSIQLPPPPGASSPSPHFAHASHSGKYVYVPGLHSGKVYVIRTQDRRLVATIPTPDSAPGNLNSNPAVGPNGLGAHHAAPSHDGSMVLVAHWATNRIYKVAADEEAESWQIVDSASVGARPICIVYHPDGTRAYVGTAPSGIAVVDLADLSVETTLATVGAWSCSWAQTRDGRTMYLSTNAPGGRVYSLDLTTNTLTLQLMTGSSHLHGMGMSADERTLFLTSRDEDELHIVAIPTWSLEEELSLDATPGLPDKPDTVAVRGDNVYVTLRWSGKLAVVKAKQRTVRYHRLTDACPQPDPPPAPQLCYALHSVELMP